MIRLGVNIDHVATVRQARRTIEPDPVAAAVLALLGGADGITVHLREDRRHIQERDVRLLRQVVTNRLNLEMSVADEVVARFGAPLPLRARRLESPGVGNALPAVARWQTRAELDVPIRLEAGSKLRRTQRLGACVSRRP